MSLEERYEKSRIYLLTADALFPNGHVVNIQTLRQRQNLDANKLNEIEQEKKNYARLRRAIVEKKRVLDIKSGERPSKRVKLSDEEVKHNHYVNATAYMDRVRNDPLRYAQRNEKLRLAYYKEYFKKVKERAQRKKIAFDLNEDEVMKLTAQPCFYCRTLERIGLDRKNSNLSYHIDNVLPCCGICNMMKQGHLPNVFVERCRDIIKHQLDPTYQAIDYYHAKQRRSFEGWCKWKKWPGTIDETLWKQLKEGNCFGCGAVGPNGIDRINPKEGYTLNNVQTACVLCNYSKWRYSQETFLEKCAKIVEAHSIIPTQEQHIECLKCKSKKAPLMYGEAYCGNCYHNTFLSTKRKQH